MENAAEQMSQVRRASELGGPEGIRSDIAFDQIRQIARGSDDLIVLTPKQPQPMETLRELLEDLHAIDRSNRWLVLPYGVRIEQLSDERLKRLGLQRIPGHLGQLG